MEKIDTYRFTCGNCSHSFHGSGTRYWDLPTFSVHETRICLECKKVFDTIVAELKPKPVERKDPYSYPTFIDEWIILPKGFLENCDINEDHDLVKEVGFFIRKDNLGNLRKEYLEDFDVIKSPSTIIQLPDSPFKLTPTRNMMEVPVDSLECLFCSSTQTKAWSKFEPGCPICDERMEAVLEGYFPYRPYWI